MIISHRLQRALNTVCSSSKKWSLQKAMPVIAKLEVSLGLKKHCVYFVSFLFSRFFSYQKKLRITFPFCLFLFVFSIVQHPFIRQHDRSRQDGFKDLVPTLLTNRRMMRTRRVLYSRTPTTASILSHCPKRLQCTAQLFSSSIFLFSHGVPHRECLRNVVC